MGKKAFNLLEMAPVLKEKIQLVREKEKYLALVPRSSWLERLSVRFLKQPLEIRVELDSLGNTVLQHCNGTYTVQQIADLLCERFGKDAEPALPRLVKFLQIVELNGWISWNNASNS